MHVLLLYINCILYTLIFPRQFVVRVNQSLQIPDIIDPAKDMFKTVVFICMEEVIILADEDASSSI